MNSLEQSYRRLLRAYPRRWREEHGEELLGVLLELAPDDQTGPTGREALDLIWNGLRARSAGAIDWLPVNLRERVGLLSLGGGAALSAYCLLFGEYVVPEERGSALLRLGPIYSAGSLLYAAWVAATVLAVTGLLKRLRRVAGLLMSLVALLIGVHILSPGLVTMPPLHLLGLLGGLSGLGLLTPRTPKRADRAMLGLTAATLGVGICSMSAGVLLNGGGGYTFYRWTIPNLADGSWLIAAAIMMSGAIASLRRPGWALATAVASVPWICFALLFVIRNGPHAEPAILFLGAVLVVGMLFQDGVRATQARPA